MKQKNKKIGDYVIIIEEILGEGSFGRTYKAIKNKNIEIPYACKIIEKSTIKAASIDENYFIKRVQQQFKALQTLKHKNIVKFEDSEETKNNLYMFFQYCDSNLETYIEVNKFHPNNIQEIQEFARQIISGCHHFTSKGFVHRDIKPANLLIKNGEIKIADFGLAKLIKQNNETATVTFAGTPHYMAPEIMKETCKLKQIKKCDVWSTGVTLFELATGLLPFKMQKKQLSQAKIIDKIQNSKYLIEIKNSPLLEKVVRGMLVIQPSQRISFEEANHIIAGIHSI